ncbi:MAG: CPBP family intramembrane metalloprotease [Treponema sp.]|jgi:membrane protease YdiL (CAAX protease family)|nr:CPBP family intramembrane metalloprotease [Treponema sp.]
MIKKDSFSVKDAVQLCLFLLGCRTLAELLLYLFRIDLILVYDIAFLVVVIFIIKKSGKKELDSILQWREVPAALFFALVVMYFGMEILRREIGNIFAIILLMPDGFFDHSYHRGVFMTLLSNAVFPAVTEELFFRGVILKRLQKNYSRRKALLVSSLLFGLLHLNPWQALLAFISGLFLGWIYLQWKIIWLCMFIHCYNNILASFLSFPVNYLPNTRSFSVLVLHPLWLDILGILLFLTGLAAVLASGKRKNPTT